MARREEWSVKELTIVEGGGIRAGVAAKLAKTLRFYICVPATIVDNRYKANGVMSNTTYTLTNNGLPGDGLAHNVTVTTTRADVVDTLGSIRITGLDFDGKVITEDIVPVDNTVANGTKAFKQVTSMVHTGWAQGGTTADSVRIGFGELIGLPEKIATEDDILLVASTTALINAPTITHSDTVLALNTIAMNTGDGTKKLRVLYQI